MSSFGDSCLSFWLCNRTSNYEGCRLPDFLIPERDILVDASAVCMCTRGLLNNAVYGNWGVSHKKYHCHAVHKMPN